MKAAFAALALAGLVAIATDAKAQEKDSTAAPRRVGVAEKICQLTGETDWQSGQPTAAKSLSRFGLDAADLGYPVEHQGKLVLLFGDSWPTLQPPGALVETPPNDAVGIVTSKAQPSATECLGMHILDKPGLTMRVQNTGTPMPVFAPATVTGPSGSTRAFLMCRPEASAWLAPCMAFSGRIIAPRDIRSCPRPGRHWPAPAAMSGVPRMTAATASGWV